MSSQNLEHCLALEQCPARRALMRDWVLTPGSLTERLRVTFGKTLTHHLQTVGWGSAEQEGASNPLIWKRYIRFKVCSETMVSAEVIIPLESLHSPIGLQLQYCGARSLGDVIFKDPTAHGRIMSYDSDTTQQTISRHILHKPFGQALWITEHFHAALFNKPEVTSC